VSSESPLSRAVAERGIAVGAMLYEFDTSGIMRILAGAGVDFAIFDLEHTGWDAGTMRTVLAAGRGTGVHPIIRVIRPHYHLIATALDAGARGVMAPMVETEAEARLVVESAKYPPLGKRGFGLLYSDDLADGAPAIVERANRTGTVIAQIESVAGIENAEAIAGVEGVDVVWLGHFDLSLSLGVPGQFDHPDFVHAVDRLVSACRRCDKPLGQMVSGVEQGRALRAAGFQVLAFSDIWVFEGALRDGITELRS
jgi:2-keto-3-deoxy-L-rhamnonate aldolase RhmA